MVRGLECLSYRDKLKELGMLIPERRQVKGYTAVYSYLMAGCREDRHVSKMHTGKMRCTRNKLEHRKFRLDTRKMGGQTLEQAPGEFAGTPSLELSRSQLGILA